MDHPELLVDRSSLLDRQSAQRPVLLAHELRTPLACATCAVRLLLQPGLEDSTRVSTLTMLERQLRHMSRLIEDWLDGASARGGALLPIRPGRTDLRMVIGQAIEAHAHAIAAQEHQLTFAIEGEPVWVLADADRLAQVFGNLLGNAIKYTPSGGRISVWIHLRPGSVIVRVRDSGIGIASELLPRIFELYRQAEPASARAGGGLGIGLAVVQDLVQRHGGQVTASSAGTGRGSEFAVCLPLGGQTDASPQRLAYATTKEPPRFRRWSWRRPT